MTTPMIADRRPDQPIPGTLTMAGKDPGDRVNGPGAWPIPWKGTDMTEAICACCDRGKRLIARGLCGACYQRSKANGTLDQYSPAKLRFADALRRAQAAETDEGCWPWPVVDENTGYSRAGSGRTRAHIATYEQEHGPVPDGLTLDHVCHSRSECSGGPSCPHRRCVRPDHLEPVSARDQQERRPARRMPQCRRGHLRSRENTRYRTDRGYRIRVCLDCHLEDQHKYRDRRAEPSSS